nr:hypothetical protein [Tanacetum cinerariifolium]
MRTRSSSNLPVVSPLNPSTSNPKRRNRRCSKQPFILKEYPVDTMANQRTVAELLHAPTEGGIVLDGPSVPTPPSFINPEVDECVEETLTDQDLFEYTIKVPPPPVQKYKPPSQRDFVVHQRDPL